MCINQTTDLVEKKLMGKACVIYLIRHGAGSSNGSEAGPPVPAYNGKLQWKTYRKNS